MQNSGAKLPMKMVHSQSQKVSPMSANNLGKQLGAFGGDHHHMGTISSMDSSDEEDGGNTGKNAAKKRQKLRRTDKGAATQNYQL